MRNPPASRQSRTLLTPWQILPDFTSQQRSRRTQQHLLHAQQAHAGGIGHHLEDHSGGVWHLHGRREDLPVRFQVTGEMVAKLLAVEGINASWIGQGYLRYPTKTVMRSCMLMWMPGWCASCTEPDHLRQPGGIPAVRSGSGCKAWDAKYHPVQRLLLRACGYGRKYRGGRGCPGWIPS